MIKPRCADSAPFATLTKRQQPPLLKKLGGRIQGLSASCHRPFPLDLGTSLTGDRMLETVVGDYWLVTLRLFLARTALGELREARGKVSEGLRDGIARIPT